MSLAGGRVLNAGRPPVAYDSCPQGLCQSLIWQGMCQVSCYSAPRRLAFSTCRVQAPPVALPTPHSPRLRPAGRFIPPARAVVPDATRPCSLLAQGAPTTPPGQLTTSLE